MRGLAIADVLYVWGLMVVIDGGWWLGLREAGVLLICWAGFLIERVKVARVLMDPADAESDPARWRVHARWGGWFRIAALVALIVGVVLMALEMPEAVVFVPLGAVCVFGYGHVFRRGEVAYRLKNVPVLKNVMVASSYAGAVVLVGALGRDADGWAVLVGMVWMLVFADSVLCDVPDQASDGANGVHTLVVMLGELRARLLGALLLFLVGVVGMVVGGEAFGLGWLAWSGVLVALCGRVSKIVVDGRAGVVAVVWLMVS